MPTSAKASGPGRMADDEALLDVLSSANIACGFHAGDPLIMERTVRAALARGVESARMSASPTARASAGRVMHIDADELAAIVTYQLGALAGIARARAPHVAHELPRGARKHGRGGCGAGRAARRGRSAVRSGPRHRVVVEPGDRGRGRALRLRVATTFLADRAYDGTGFWWRARFSSSVIHDEGVVLARVRASASGGRRWRPRWHGARHASAQDPGPRRHAGRGRAGAASHPGGQVEAAGGRVVPVSCLAPGGLIADHA